MRIGLFYCRHLKVKGQPNPRSDSEFSFISSRFKGSHLDTELENKLYNIQSFTNKKDILETELSNFDVIYRNKVRSKN